MSKPGPHPWAENDTYVAGPDVGSDTKTESLAVHREDGYYRTRRPGPDILNWQLNRAGLLQQTVARMRATTMVPQESYVSATYGALATMIYEQGNNRWLIFTIRGTDVYAFSSIGYEELQAVGVAYATVTAVAVDSASGSIVESITVVEDSVNTDVVLRNLGGAGFPAVTITGAPGKNWVSVGCDRNVGGSGNDTFMIGDDGAGPSAPVLYSIVGAGNATAVAGFPALAAGRKLQCIEHTQHGAGAIGPSDAGNPSWLVLTNTEAIRSTDGVTWTSANHGLASIYGNRCAAYSRTSGRWVVVELNSGSLTTTGDVSYSDDNGATWTTLSGVIDAFFGPGNISCDGYGTFVIFNNTSTYISVDEGLTWIKTQLPKSSNDGILGVSFDASVDVDQMPTYPTFFKYLQEQPGVAIHVVHSLAE